MNKAGKLESSTADRPGNPPQDGSVSPPTLIPARGNLSVIAAPLAGDPRPPSPRPRRERRHFGRFLYPRLLVAFDDAVYASVDWSLAGTLLSGYSGRRDVGDEIQALVRLRPDCAWHCLRAVVVRRAPARGEIVLGYVRYGLGLARLLDESVGRRNSACRPRYDCLGSMLVGRDPR